MKKHIYIATGITAAIGGLITASMLSSCETECTKEARASAIVQFIAQEPGSSEIEGVGASELWFKYTDETGNIETLRGQCSDDACTEVLLSYERPGHYEVHATVCGQEYVREFTVDMDDDLCHVETEWVRIQVDSSTCAAELDPAQEVQKPGPTCTLEARYSAVVTVVGEVEGREQPVATQRRYFKWSGDEDQRQWPGMCLSEDCSQFAVGIEQTGRFEVGAVVCGELVAKTVAVEKTADGCHVDTQEVTLVASLDNCDEPPKPLYPPSDPACTLESRPSAIVMPVIDGGDVWLPYPTEQMWYEHGDSRYAARCAGELDTNGKCSRWITGWELDGRFKVHTETCDVISTVEYSVQKTMDGCHVETVYVPVFMDTRGCIQAPQPPRPEPVPMLTYK